MTAHDPVHGLLRKTGIRVLGDVPWGTHICAFYETREDLLETCLAYFTAGLKDNEFGVWAVSGTVTKKVARDRLRRDIGGFDRYLAAGQIEILHGREWYLGAGQFDLKRITNGWSEKLSGALARGFTGMRVSGNAFWLQTSQWKEFCEYEYELDRSLANQRMIVLCTYSLKASRAVDLMDAARAHQCAIARRNGTWEYLETPDLKRANEEIARLRDALDILSTPFPGHEQLTPRERVALAQIVRGATSKEAARALSVSPRTIEFHRKNIMQKLGAKNSVDLVLRVLGKS